MEFYLNGSPFFSVACAAGFLLPENKGGANEESGFLFARGVKGQHGPGVVWGYTQQHKHIIGFLG